MSYSLCKNILHLQTFLRHVVYFLYKIFKHLFHFRLKVIPTLINDSRQLVCVCMYTYVLKFSLGVCWSRVFVGYVFAPGITTIIYMTNDCELSRYCFHFQDTYSFCFSMYIYVYDNPMDIIHYYYHICRGEWEWYGWSPFMLPSLLIIYNCVWPPIASILFTACHFPTLKHGQCMFSVLLFN